MTSKGGAAAALVVAGAISAAGSAASAADACKILQIGELPAKIERGSIYIDGKINNVPTRYIVETGSIVSSIWRDQVSRFGLPLSNVRGVQMYGVGGVVALQVATLHSFSIGTATRNNFNVYVLGSSRHIGDASMLLGSDFFAQTDVEFDLAHGVIRLLLAKGCADAQMVYWNQPYSEVRYTVGRLGDSSSAGFGDTAFYTTAKLNGHSVDVEIDSGASATVVDADLARRLGARTDPDSSSSMGGVGSGELKVHTAVLDTFSLGDETIRNARLQTAKLFSNVHIAETGTRLGYDVATLDQPRMLLGADFLAAHRVLLSPKHQMMYFSYAGGPVFQVQTPARRVGGDPAAAPPPGGEAASPPASIAPR